MIWSVSADVCRQKIDSTVNQTQFWAKTLRFCLHLASTVSTLDLTRHSHTNSQAAQAAHATATWLSKDDGTLSRASLPMTVSRPSCQDCLLASESNLKCSLSRKDDVCIRRRQEAKQGDGESVGGTTRRLYFGSRECARAHMIHFRLLFKYSAATLNPSAQTKAK